MQVADDIVLVSKYAIADRRIKQRKPESLVKDDLENFFKWMMGGGQGR